MPLWWRRESRIREILERGPRSEEEWRELERLASRCRELDLLRRVISLCARENRFDAARRILESLGKRGLDTSLLEAELLLAEGSYSEALRLAGGREGTLWKSVEIRALSGLGRDEEAARLASEILEKLDPDEAGALVEELVSYAGPALRRTLAVPLLRHDPARALELLRDDSSPEGLELRSRAREALGDLEGALQDMLKVATLRPEPDIMLRLGKLASELGKGIMAEEALRRAAEGGLEEAALRLGELLEGQGRTLEAAEAYSMDGEEGKVRAAELYLEAGEPERALKALEGIPEDPRVLKVKGISLWRLGRPKEALEKLDALLVIKEDEEALEARASVLEALGEEEELGRTLLRLGELRGDPVPLVRGARILLRHGACDEAIPRLKVALATGLDGEVLEALMEILASLGRWEDVVEVYEGVGESTPRAEVLHAEALARVRGDLSRLRELASRDPEAMVRLARILTERGRVDEALGLLREACRVRPSWESYSMLGTALAEAGRLREAISALRASLTFRDDPETRLSIAELLLRMGDVEGAEREAADLLESGVGNRAKGLLARCLMAKGELRKAIALLEELRNSDACDTRCLAALAEAYRRAGRTDEALALLEGRGDLGPEGLRILSELYIERGRWVDALLALARLERLEGLGPRELALRGRAEEGLGRFRDAVRDYVKAYEGGLKESWLRERMIEALYRGGSWEELTKILSDSGLPDKTNLILARALAERGDLGRAMEIASREYPEELRGLRNLVMGRIHELRGELEAALKSYRDSGEGESMARASGIYAQLGDLQNALVSMRRGRAFSGVVAEVALSLAAGPVLEELLPRVASPTQRARILAVLGRCEEAEGELSVGQAPPPEIALCHLLAGRRKRAFEVAMSSLHRGGDCELAFAVAFLAAGNSRDMLRTLEKTLKGVKSPDARLALARMDLRLGKFKSASKNADKAIKFGLGLDALLVKGEALLNLEDFRGARRVAEAVLAEDPDSVEGSVLLRLARERRPIRVFEIRGELVGDPSAVPGPRARTPTGLPPGSLAVLERRGFLLAGLYRGSGIPSLGEAVALLRPYGVLETLRLLSYIEGVLESDVDPSVCRFLPRVRGGEDLLATCRRLRCGPYLAKILSSCAGAPRVAEKMERVVEGQEEEEI